MLSIKNKLKKGKEMQLYIVWFSNFDSQDELMGIYADEENAKRFIEGFDSQEQEQLRIDEYSLDD